MWVKREIAEEEEAQGPAGLGHGHAGAAALVAGVAGKGFGGIIWKRKKMFTLTNIFEEDKNKLAEKNKLLQST